ncbi:soxA, partial [Symbiodinium sp. KB8]
EGGYWAYGWRLFHGYTPLECGFSTAHLQTLISGASCNAARLSTVDRFATPCPGWAAVAVGTAPAEKTTLRGLPLTQLPPREDDLTFSLDHPEDVPSLHATARGVVATPVDATLKTDALDFLAPCSGAAFHYHTFFLGVEQAAFTLECASPSAFTRSHCPPGHLRRCAIIRSLRFVGDVRTGDSEPDSRRLRGLTYVAQCLTRVWLPAASSACPCPPAPPLPAWYMDRNPFDSSVYQDEAPPSTEVLSFNVGGAKGLLYDELRVWLEVERLTEQSRKGRAVMMLELSQWVKPEGMQRSPAVQALQKMVYRGQGKEQSKGDWIARLRDEDGIHEVERGHYRVILSAANDAWLSVKVEATSFCTAELMIMLSLRLALRASPEEMGRHGIPSPSSASTDELDETIKHNPASIRSEPSLFRVDPEMVRSSRWFGRRGARGLCLAVVGSSVAFVEPALRGAASAALAAALTAAPPPAAAADWFSFIWGLKTDEQVLEQQEESVEEDLQKQPWANIFDRARLLNLEATLKAEETTVQAEEKDVEVSASRGQDFRSESSAFRKDEQKLQGLSRLAERLQFDDKESAELKDLTQRDRKSFSGPHPPALPAAARLYSTKQGRARGKPDYVCSSVAMACLSPRWLLGGGLAAAGAYYAAVKYRRPVVVVGGGVMGLSTAARLAERGYRVVVLDENHPIRGSWGSTRASHLRMEDPVLLQMSLFSIRSWLDLQERMRTRFGPDEADWFFYKRTGGLMAGPASIVEAMAEKIRREVPTKQGEVEVLTAAETPERFPQLHLDPKEKLLYMPEGYTMSVPTTLHGLRWAAEAAGAEYQEDSVVSIDLRRKMVFTKEQSIRFSQVVITAGPWTNRILQGAGLRGVPMIVSNEQTVEFQPKVGAPSHDWSDLPLFTWSEAGYKGRNEDGGCLYFYTTPHCPLTSSGSQGVKVGFHRQGPLLDTDEFVVTESGRASKEKLPNIRKELRTEQEYDLDEFSLSKIKAFIKSKMPGLDADHSVGYMRCLYQLTPDLQMIVGRHPDDRSVVLACGFSGSGFQLLCQP